MEGLTEGRIVHFVMPNGKHRPAIVVQVWRVPYSDGPEPITKAPESGCSNLQVFSDSTNDVPWDEHEREQFLNYTIPEEGVRRGLFWKTSVLFSEEPKPNTWHWPEKA